VTGDPTGFGRSAEVQEIPGQQRFPVGSVEEPNLLAEDGFSPAWTRCGRVEIELRARNGEVEASLLGYPLRETGRTAWEAVNRLVAAHRGLLERRWSTDGAGR
jgi:hypothetical protein